MATKVYTVQEFVQDARAIVDRGLDEPQTIALITEPLSRLISREDCLRDVAPDGNPDPEAGFSIYRSDHLSIMAVIWAPESGAPVHNHNGWAVEGVVRGEELNHNYQRLDDATVPWFAKLEEVDPSVVRAGETTSLMLPPNDIHAVEIPKGKTLAIHVYGVDLAKQWRYRFDLATGEVTPYRMRPRAR